MSPEALEDALAADEHSAACRLAAAAAARFPDHSELQATHRVLNEGGASVGTGGPEPDRSADLRWLSDPPESVRGQWVALVDGELAGASDSLAELIEQLRDRGLEKKALVHPVE